MVAGVLFLFKINVLCLQHTLTFSGRPLFGPKRASLGGIEVHSVHPQAEPLTPLHATNNFNSTKQQSFFLLVPQNFCAALLLVFDGKTGGKSEVSCVVYGSSSSTSLSALVWNCLSRHNPAEST